MRTSIIIACCVAPVVTASAAAGANLAVWTAPSVEKVMKTSKLRRLEPAEISAARGEHEAFQIVLRAGRSGAKGVTIKPGSLRSPKGIISGSRVNVYLAHYVFLPAFNEWYPDALPPYQGPFDLSAGQTQPVWVDIDVPRDAAAGDYAGTIAISVENGETINVPVKLKVYNFEMPPGPAITTAFGLWWNKYIAHAHGLSEDSPAVQALMVKYYEFLLDRGVSAFDIPFPIGSEEWTKYATDPRVTSFKVEYSKDEQKIASELKQIKALGVWDKAYFYPVDEPIDEKHYNELTDVCKFLRGIDPKVNIVSPYFRNPSFGEGKTVYDLLTGHINIWCFNTGFYDEKALAERRAAGDKIWNYVCCGPGKPYSNFFVDQAGLEHRMLFWQNYFYEVTGLLYWNTIFWDPGSTTDPWEDIATVKWINPNVYGDGSLLYPGKKVGINGPVSSIRLEVIRDGIEDYTYLALLERKIGREATLAYVKQLVTNWQEYTRDYAEFARVRNEIAAKIEQ